MIQGPSKYLLLHFAKIFLSQIAVITMPAGFLRSNNAFLVVMENFVRLLISAPIATYSRLINAKKYMGVVCLMMANLACKSFATTFPRISVDISA